MTIAISTRDRARQLARCLEAIERGTVRPAEIVVVDQSRDDDTRVLVANRPEIVYVHHGGSGLGAAQNVAFAAATEPVVAVTDDDCIPDVTWVQTLEEAFSGREAPDAVTGRVLPLPAVASAVHPVATRESTAARDFSGVTPPWEVGSGNNFAARRDLLLSVGGNDERLGPGAPGLGGVDMDLFYRLLRAGARIRYEPRAVVHHERTTRAGRRARRFPYGHGVGAMCALWLRRRDPYAVALLARWIVSRLRRLVRGALAGNLERVYEETLVLTGTLVGLFFGARVDRSD